MLVCRVLLFPQIDTPWLLSACSQMSRILSGNRDLESLDSETSVEEETGEVEDAGADWHMPGEWEYVVFLLGFYKGGRCLRGNATGRVHVPEWTRLYAEN